MANTRIYSLLIVILVIVASCGKHDNKSQSNANAASADPSPNAQAVEIGNLLKAKGIPLTPEVLNSTDAFKGIMPDNTNQKAGILSDATTWTDTADISITVFDSEQHRKEARARIEKVPGTTYYAECGGIQIIFTPDQSKPNKEVERQAKKTVEILKAAYGCK